MTNIVLINPKPIKLDDHVNLRDKMKAIYKFNWNFGRNGSIEGLFVEFKSYVEALIGQQVNFGEVLGKHSEVCGVLGEDDLEMISDDPSLVETVEQYDLTSGYNPIAQMLDDCHYEEGFYFLDDGTKVKKEAEDDLCE